MGSRFVQNLHKLTPPCITPMHFNLTPTQSYWAGKLASIVVAGFWLSLQPAPNGYAADPATTTDRLSVPMTRPRSLEPGWGPWQPIAEQDTAQVDTGFSNTEMGSYLNLQYFCAEQSGQPGDTFPNWFRVSALVRQIGTGMVEYGCWTGDRFISTLTSTAIDRRFNYVDCLLAVSRQGEALAIYEAPGLEQRVLGTLNRGDTVNPGSFPAVVTQTEELNWIAISSPVEGWVIQGAPSSGGNFRVCDRQPLR